MQAQKRRLGRGLAALIGDDTPDNPDANDTRQLRQVPIELLRANPNNPRKTFKDEDLEDLAQSIREKGLLQPLLVRSLGDGYHEIVAGERRWRAAQRAGIHDVPVLVRELTDGEALEIALIENIQRSDLNAIEEARAYAQLVEQFGYTQQQLAQSVGKSRSHVSNTLRLLSLPQNIRQHIERGVLTAGHARTLVAAEKPEDLAQQIIDLGMSVRGAEELSRQQGSDKGPPANRKTREKTPDVRALEKELSEILGLKVELQEKGKTAGTVSIRYSSLDQLDDLTSLFRSRKN
jgi:ParB family chromosome partitioning protein